MKWCGLKGIKSRIITAMMIFSIFLSYTSAPVFAAGVEIDNHYSDHTGKKQVSGLTIDGVKAPVSGQRLDDSAEVRTKEGYRWEIAVVWLNDKQQVATKAVEGEKYIPTLAFYVPSGYMLSGKAFGVEVSDVLAGLMGSSSLTSVYEASSGITFIIPITVVGTSRSADKLGSDLEEAKELTYQEWLDSSADTGAFIENRDAGGLSGESKSDNSNSEDSSEDGATSASEDRSIVEIYCAQTARDALTDDDLETIIDLVVNKLEPQAVELLKESFSAFKEAADNGEIGQEIGLYIYYSKGDKDGLEEHDTPKDALAYVSSREKDIDGELKYTYMLGVDLDSLVKTDKDGKAIINPKTGKYSLLFEGKDMETFTNTIVHEMFHAFMDDYNRTGMAGATNLQDIVLNEKGEFRTKELAEKYDKLHFPKWFIEGTASAVENTYEFRYDSFTAYRQLENSKEYYDKYSQDSILNNYVTNSNKAYLNLSFTSGYDEGNKEIDDSNSNYVTGYLASLYLADLAYKASTGAKKTGDENGFDSATFREGLSYILESLHKGKTLDNVINEISPVDKNGKKIYKDTDAFQEKFISGKPDEKGYCYGDESSLTFVTNYLNYMRSLESESRGNKKVPNGSILFDFDEDYSEPIDKNKEASSDYYKIVRSNVSIPSTVKSDIAEIGGGKSDLNSRKDEGKNKLQIAAKQKKVEAKPAATKAQNEGVKPAAAKEQNGEVKPVAVKEQTEETEPLAAITDNKEAVGAKIQETVKVQIPGYTTDKGNTTGNAQGDPVGTVDEDIEAGDAIEPEELEEAEENTDGENTSEVFAGKVSEGVKADTEETNVIATQGEGTVAEGEGVTAELESTAVTGEGATEAGEEVAAAKNDEAVEDNTKAEIGEEATEAENAESDGDETTIEGSSTAPEETGAPTEEGSKEPDAAVPEGGDLKEAVNKNDDPEDMDTDTVKSEGLANEEATVSDEGGCRQENDT